VTPQHRGTLTEPDQERLTAALAGREASDAEMRAAVLAAVENGGSVRELAAFTGLSTSTISRWKRGE
jgi:transposase-like protein